MNHCYKYTYRNKSVYLEIGNSDGFVIPMLPQDEQKTKGLSNYHFQIAIFFSIQN